MITLQTLKKQLETHLAVKSEQGQGWNRVLAFNLRMAVAWMEYRKIESIHSIGCFVKDGIALPAAGQTIIVPKGLTFKTLRPSQDTDCFKADRAVVVHRITGPGARGFHEEYSNEPASIQELPIEITWAGKGGYWSSVTLNEWIEAGGDSLTRKLAIKKMAQRHDWRLTPSNKARPPPAR